MILAGIHAIGIAGIVITASISLYRTGHLPGHRDVRIDDALMNFINTNETLTCESIRHICESSGTAN